MNNQICWAKGRKARYDNEPRSSNPYNFGYGPAEAWDNGWVGQDAYMRRVK